MLFHSAAQLNYDYVIENFADFQEIQLRVNNSTEGESTRYPGAVNGGGFAGKIFRMINDVDFNYFAWTGIGATSTTPFKGILDGDGNAILNLNFTNASTQTGLFIYLENATIKNIIIKGDITNTSTNARAILSPAVTGTCYFQKIISHVNMTNGGTCVWTHTTIGTVQNVEDCYNFGNLKATNTAWAVGMFTATTNGLINAKRCANFGNLSNNNSTSQTLKIGIFSVDNAVIENCYNAGAITNRTTSNANLISSGVLAGAGGATNFQVHRSYNIGNVTGYQNSKALIAYPVPAVQSANYHLSTLSPGAGYNGVSKTEAELKSGALFEDRVWIERAGKYPILPFRIDLQDQYLNQ